MEKGESGGSGFHLASVVGEAVVGLALTRAGVNKLKFGPVQSRYGRSEADNPFHSLRAWLRGDLYRTLLRNYQNTAKVSHQDYIPLVS